MNIPGWSEEMMKSWTDAQQKYWNHLLSMSGETASINTAAPGWAEAMEKWWSIATPQMPVQASELMDRVFEMSKVYTHLAENAMATASRSENNNGLESWMTAMENSFKGLAEGNSAMWQEQLKKVLNLSGFGEHTSPHNQQLLEELSNAYQTALQNYMEAFAGHGLTSVRALRDRIAQMGSEGMSIASLRELYDLWVDVSEEAYQKFAFSDEYQKVYGEMVNAFVALKGALDTVRDSQLQALRILTADDLDKVLQQQQKVVQENADLQKEIQELKEQVATMATATNNQATEEPVTEENDNNNNTIAAVEQKPETTLGETTKQAERDIAAVEPEAEDKQPDDLTRIKGLGPKMQEKLFDAGIQTFDQLAALSDDQTQKLDKQIDARGRLVRDKWVTQAAELSGRQSV
ncbi:MAG: hypothetical protein CSA79_01135 [Thiothrix nivea]|nr:MAG: hypothetical protein CSA79_01135 [Thiothrix nivea]